MTSDSALLVIVSLIIGAVMGFMHGWSFAKKLEHHEVKLKDWDKKIDFEAETQNS